MLAAGEILRRTMWGCFRLEWEHISTQRSAKRTRASRQQCKQHTGAALRLHGPRLFLFSSLVAHVRLCGGAVLLCSCHRIPDAIHPAVIAPEMSGYKVIMEVVVLVVMVLSIGTTAALTAN